MAGYIEEQLQHERGERIVRLTQLSLWGLLPALVVSAACFVAGVWLLLTLPPESVAGRFAVPGAAALGVLGAAIGARALVRFYTTEIGVTTHRVLMKTGLVARRAPEMVLDAIESQALDQSGAGRVLGFGTVEVRGAGGERITIRGVDDPIALKEAIGRAQEARHVRDGDVRRGGAPQPLPLA